MPRNISKHAHVASVHCRVCLKEHRAVTGLLDHDDTCHGSLCKNTVFFLDCQRYTLTLKVRCASPSVSNHFRFPGFKRFTADSDNCGKLPITTIGFRSSSVVQHLALPAGSFKLHQVLKSRTTSGSMSSKSFAATAFCHLGRAATQLSQSHHLTARRLVGPALCTVLQPRQPCIFGRSSCSSRCVCASPLPESALLLLLLWPMTISGPGGGPPFRFLDSSRRSAPKCVVTHGTLPLVFCIRFRERLIDYSLCRLQDNLDIPEFDGTSRSRRAV